MTAPPRSAPPRASRLWPFALGLVVLLLPGAAPPALASGTPPAGSDVPPADPQDRPAATPGSNPKSRKKQRQKAKARARAQAGADAVPHAGAPRVRENKALPQAELTRGASQDALKERLREKIAALTSGGGAMPRAMASAAPAASLFAGVKLRADQLRAKGNYAEAILSHEDLRGIDLTGVNLTGADLRGADLRDADLTGAKLKGARMAGARLEGARLYMASLYEASGVNLEGVRAHPFFESKGDPVGTVKVCELSDPRWLPDRILAGPQGDLFLLQKGKPEPWVITRTGQQFTVLIQENPLGGLRTMTMGAGKVWFFGTKAFRSMGNVMTGGGSMDAPETIAMAPQCASSAVVTGDGALWVIHPDRWARYTSTTTAARSEQLSFTEMNHLPKATSLITSNGRSLFAADGRKDFILYWNGPGTDYLGLITGEGSRPLSLAADDQHRVWYTAPGTQQIGYLTFPDGGEPERAEPWTAPAPEGGPAPNLGLHHITRGPDGHMWFTQKTPPAIGRIDSRLAPTFYPLPAGMVPGDITAGPDGNLYFTIDGQAVIGSIRAGAPPAAVPAGWATPAAPAPAPEPRGRTDRERREDAYQRFLKSLEVQEKPAAPAAPRPEPASPAPAAEPLRPRAVLAGLGVTLSDAAIRHILARHGSGAAPADDEGPGGQFRPEFSTTDTLAPLLAEALGAAGDVGRVIRRYDKIGRRHTPCRLGREVGWHQAWGQWRATEWLDVVTQEEFRDGVRHHTVITAYPVNPGAF